MDTDAPTVVDIFVDPACPWAWQTSRWLREVAELRPIVLRWRLMSLSVLNENLDMTDEYRQLMGLAWRPVRVLAAVQAAHGEDSFAALYDAIARRFHREERRADVDAVIAEALEEVGLPAELVAAVDDTTHDGAVRAAHAEAMASYGEDMGTPLIAVDGVTFFGPVISVVPRGELAAEAWDATLRLVKIPGFYEIKRRRERDLDFS